MFEVFVMVFSALIAVLTFGTAGRSVALSRYRACVKCPIFRKGFHQCRADFKGKQLGCGCYMPFKVVFTPTKKPWCWKSGA